MLVSFLRGVPVLECLDYIVPAASTSIPTVAVNYRLATHSQYHIDIHRTSSSLQGPQLRGKITDDRLAGRLINTLLKKPTLEELHSEGVIETHSDAHNQTLKAYFRSTTVLKVFTITINDLSLQTAVLEGVLENGSIEKLTLRLFEGTEESTALVSRIIKDKGALHSLSISLAILSADSEPLGLHSLYDCWASHSE
ncbi:hypothetical protein HPB51_012340 [Rhipicephalus microplus]|uniref:Uncharacterized protein n=1 Tax=Rhipicephalus microplus TaxID=6941 RepID=A0A9J6DGN7_RHIMP|nr:hypothetical protein HPB51_012340 [Rhipicephalus microplus]